jgi:hypothetical protein
MSSESPRHNHLDALLRELPYTEEPVSTEQQCISGVLVRSKPGVVCIVVGEYCFTFDVADIQDAFQISAKGEDTCMPTVRLILRSPAQLLNVEPWTEFDRATSGAPRPFAFAVRPQPIVVPPNPDFDSREQSFLRNIQQ